MKISALKPIGGRRELHWEDGGRGAGWGVPLLLIPSSSLPYILCSTFHRDNAGRGMEKGRQKGLQLFSHFRDGCLMWLKG